MNTGRLMALVKPFRNWYLTGTAAAAAAAAASASCFGCLRAAPPLPSAAAPTSGTRLPKKSRFRGRAPAASADAAACGHAHRKKTSRANHQPPPGHRGSKHARKKRTMRVL